jgi:hypothetical protein
MFKTVDLLGIVGPLKNGWVKLNRKIQTKVEHQRVFNATGAPVIRGHVMCGVAGAEQVGLADASAAATSEWCGVAAEPAPIAGQFVMRTSGYALVYFDDTLALANAEGTPVYLSQTAGKATNVLPIAGFSIRMGILADATGYVGVAGPTYNPFAWVVLGHCCAPLAQNPQ